MTHGNNTIHTFRACRLSARGQLAAVCLSLVIGSGLSAEVEKNNTPERQSASEYIQLLATKKIDLEQNTAISPNCSANRRKEISKALDLIQQTLFREGDQFKVVDSKTIGKLSAVLIQSTNPITPLNPQTHALALIKKQNAWLVGPIPGSFTNTGYGYDKKVEKTVKQLQNWMAQEKATRESSSRQKAKDSFINSIQAAKKSSKLNAITAEQAIDNLIEQCRSKNLIGVLASIGADTENSELTMNQAIEFCSQGLNSKNMSSLWQLLGNPSVIVQKMPSLGDNADADHAPLPVGFWNPLVSNHLHAIHFQSFTENDHTYLHLPDQLQLEPLGIREQARAMRRHHVPGDIALKKRLPVEIFKHSQPAELTSAEEVVQQFLEALDNWNFGSCIRLLPAKGKYAGSGDEPQQKRTLTYLSRLWKSLYQLKGTSRQNLKIIADENLALLPLQYASNKRPGEFHTINVWILKNKKSWYIIPADLLKLNADTHLTRSMQKIEQQLEDQQLEQQEKQAQSLMDKVTKVKLPLTTKACDGEKAQLLVTRFRTMLRNKDQQGALNCCAVLSSTNRTQALKTLNYALRGAADQTPNDLTLGVIHTEQWAGVSMRTESKTKDLDDYPLYLVANTDDGAKILLDLDLRYASNKGRKILNAAVWKSLEEPQDEATIQQIKTLFTKHVNLSETDIKASTPLKD